MSVSSPFPVTVKNKSERNARDILLGSLAVPGRRLRQWSQLFPTNILHRLFTALGAHREIARLSQFPVLAEAARVHPRLLIKYVARHYLALGLPVPARIACFVHHYRRLCSVLPIWLLRRTLLEEVPLFETSENGAQFAITMCLSKSVEYETEGELSLNLLVEDKIVYIVGFSIVPGWVVKSSASEAILISRMQGVKGYHREIAQATKSLHDVSPVVLLLAALQGIASVFDIGVMASVSAAVQVCYDERYAASFRQGYDDFFGERGIPLNKEGFFLTPIPLPEKPLANIKRGHKIRTREKRAFRQEVQKACTDFFVRNGFPAPSAEA